MRSPRTFALRSTSLVLLLAGACGPPRYESDLALAADKCPSGFVVTVVNPTNLDVDVRYGDRLIGSVGPGATETFDLPDRRNGYVRLVPLKPNPGAPFASSPDGRSALNSIRSRVHCAGT